MSSESHAGRRPFGGFGRTAKDLPPIVCIQLDSKLGDFEHNARTAENLLSASIASRNGEDSQLENGLIVLPELALTGYAFNSPEEIRPYLEARETGPTTQWAKKISKLYKCYTAIGYPEIAQGKIYNSAVVTTPDETCLYNYQKHFLYEVDYKWGANEGPAFGSFTLPGFGKVAMGICMDLSPYKFEAPFEKFEFGNFAANDVKPDVILTLMAWLDPDPSNRAKSNTEMLQYWATRLYPICKQRIGQDRPKPTVLITCNRTGIERGIAFGGSSNVMELGDNSYAPVISLPKNTQEALVLNGPSFSSE